MKKLLSAFLISTAIVSLSTSTFAATQTTEEIFRNLKSNNQQYTSVLENGEENFYIDMSQYPDNMTHEEIMNDILESRNETTRNFVENN